MQNENIESLLNSLPSCILTPREDLLAEFEHDRYYCYSLELGKDNEDSSKYEISYYCPLYDLDLISFTGSLREVAEKMVAWCKENGYLVTVK